MLDFQRIPQLRRQIVDKQAQEKFAAEGSGQNLPVLRGIAFIISSNDWPRAKRLPQHGSTDEVMTMTEISQNSHDA